MSQFQDFAKQLEVQYGVLVAEVESDKAKIKAEKERQAKKALELDEREALVAKSEAELKKQQAEIEPKLSKIRTDQQVSAQMEANAVEREMITEKEKEVDEKLALCALNLEELSKRELALAAEKENYQKKIKMQVAEGLIGKIDH